MDKDVLVVIGARGIGQAIAHRVGVGKHVVLADLRQENAAAAALTLGNAGYEVSVATVDVSSRPAVHALVITPLARDELSGPRGEGYRRMIEGSPAGRAR